MTLTLRQHKKSLFVSFLIGMVVTGCASVNTKNQAEQPAFTQNVKFEALVSPVIINELGDNEVLTTKAFWCLSCLTPKYRANQIKENLNKVFRGISAKADNCEQDLSKVLSQQAIYGGFDTDQYQTTKLHDISRFKTHSFMGALRSLEKNDRKTVEHADVNLELYFDLTAKNKINVLTCSRLTNMYRQAMKTSGHNDLFPFEKEHFESLCNNFGRLALCLETFSDEGSRVYAIRKNYKDRGFDIGEISIPHYLITLDK